MAPTITWGHATYLFGLLVLFSATAMPASAQLLESGGISPGTSALVAHITITPRFPLPGDTVTATVHNIQVYKPTARVTWVYGGSVVQEEIGAFSYEFVAGEIGSTIDLTATISPPEGRVLRTTFSQEVGSVRIIWEGVTYTPPLYPGRALASPGSEIVLQALPLLSDGKGGFRNVRDMVFAWRVDGETNPSTRGKGLDSIVIPPKSGFRGTRVSVQIEDTNGIAAMGAVTVPSTQPQIHFYAHDVVRGVSMTPIGNVVYLKGNPYTVYAEPFYASITSRSDPGLLYAWNVGGTRHSFPGSIILQPEGSGAGTARVELTLTNSASWMQRMRGQTVVRFESTASNVNTNTVPL